MVKPISSSSLNQKAARPPKTHLLLDKAKKDLGYKPNIIKRHNWDNMKDIKNSIIYNCTPVEDIEVDGSNEFIDCIVSTKTGKKLSWIQAYHQFKLYTGKELPIRSI